MTTYLDQKILTLLIPWNDALAVKTTFFIFYYVVSFIFFFLYSFFSFKSDKQIVCHSYSIANSIQNKLFIKKPLGTRPITSLNCKTTLRRLSRN